MTALGGDSLSVFANPAGLSNIRFREVHIGFNQLLSGLDTSIGQNVITGAVPFKKFTLGIGANILTLSEIYKENIYAVSAAKGSYGCTLKLLGNQYLWEDDYISDDPVLASRSKNAFTLDLGWLKEKAPWRFGAGLENIIPADLGRRESDAVPMKLKTGAALTKHEFLGLYETVFHLELDYRNTEASKNRLNYILSLEAWPHFHNFALRSGMSRDHMAFGFSFSRLTKNKGHLFLLDYAYLLPLKMGAEFSSHYISLSWRFGRVLPDEELREQEDFKTEKAADKIQKEADKKERGKTLRELLKQLRVEYRNRNFEA
ncbi:MAG TPA: hypothetical protein VJC03_04055, partial [bacterium]|nr:hypothetical protein [bacterium]